MFVVPSRLIEPMNLEKAVDLYQKAASVFEVRVYVTLTTAPWCARIGIKNEPNDTVVKIVGL